MEVFCQQFYIWYGIFYINFPHYALNHYEDPPVKIISNYENHGEELLGDDAVFKLGELYEYYLKDIPKAMDYYLKLIQDYSGSLYVAEARKHYRALRGDTVE